MTLRGRWRGARPSPTFVPRRAAVAVAIPIASGWEELTGPPSPFDSAAPPAAVLIAGSGSAVVGAGSGSDDAWVYDFAGDDYTPTDPAPGSGYQGGVLIGTKSYLVSSGGSGRVAWWESGSWTTGAVHGIDGFSGMCQVGGIIYVLWGASEFKSYDPGTDTWTTLSAPIDTSVPDVNIDNPIVDSGDGYIYLFTQSATAAYEIATDTWDDGSIYVPRPAPIKGSAVGVIDGLVYLAGGYDPSSDPVDTLDIYDIENDAWASGPVMPDGLLTATESIVGLARGGALYVFGYNGSPGFELWARKYTP